MTENVSIILNQYNIRFIFETQNLYIHWRTFATCLGYRGKTCTGLLLDDGDKMYKNIQTPGGPQKCLFISEDAFKKILCTTRKPNAIHLAKELNITIYDNKYLAFETAHIVNIQKAFAGEILKLQYVVNNYRIDLYFPEYKLAIEFDESYHENQEEEDRLRQEHISNILKCRFIRIKEADDVFTIINLIYVHIKNYGKCIA
jgi:very-short-patch-repair endonuclease